MTTEAKLWDAMQRHPHRDLALTRIESPATLGISDLEYVGQQAHGWVELKVAKSPTALRMDLPVYLNHPLSVEQSIWLMQHHKPRIHLVSWLLVGLHSRTGKWELFLLVEPSVAALIAMKRITWRELLGHKTTRSLLSMDEVNAYISKGGLK